MRLLWISACAGTFFTFLGTGLHLLATPQWLNGALLRPVLCFLHGVSLFSIINVYTYALDLRMVTTLWVSAMIGLVLLAIALAREPARVIFEARQTAGAAATRAGHIAVLFAIAALAVSPAVDNGSATTPYRTGIDQVGYSIPANTLQLGGTRSDVEGGLLRATGTNELKTAVARVMTPLSLNRQVDGEFLVGGLRRGYSQALAAMTILTGQDSVWRLSFALPGLALLSLTASVSFLLRRVFRATRLWATAGAAFVGLNCNLLNVWYEGAYAQAWVAPPALLVIALLVYGKQAKRRGVTRAAQARRFATAGLFFAGILPTYADVAVVIALLTGVAGALLILTAVLKRHAQATRDAFARVLEFALVLVGGAVIVLPYSLDYLQYAAKRYGSAAAGGFSQPHWATPAEIFGLSDMYTFPSYHLLPLSTQTMVYLSALSMLVAALCILALRGLRPLERSLVAAGVFFVAYVFYKSRVHEQASNYQYFKAYTYVLPAFTLVVVGGVARLVDQGRIGRRIPVVFAVTAAVTIATGVQYILRFDRQSRHVTESVLALASDHAAQTTLSRVAIVLTNASQANVKLGSYMAAAVVPMNWANRQPGVAVALSPELPVTVGFVEGDTDACLPCIRKKYRTKVFLDRPGLVLLSTGLLLRDVTDPRGGFDAARLHFGLRNNSEGDLAQLFPLSPGPR